MNYSLNEPNANTITRRYNKMTLPNVLFVWVFVTLLPQMLSLTRSANGGTLIKAGLYFAFLAIVFIFLFKNKIKTKVSEAMIAMLFCLLQILSDYIVGGQPITMASVINIITSLSYYLVFIAAFYYEVVDDDGIYRIAFLYDLFIIYACIFNIVKYWRSIITIFSLSNTYEVNLCSFFWTRNMFGVFLVFGVALAILRICTPREKDKKKWYWFVLIMTSINLFCTLSRSSILATVVFAIIFIIFQNKETLRKRLAITLAIIMLLSLLLYITGAYQFVLDIVIRPESGSTGRTERWADLLIQYSQGNLLFGQGSELDIMPHNTYVFVLLTGGIAMFVFYAVLYFKTFKSILGIMKFSRSMGVFFFAIFVSYVGVASMTETVLVLSSSASSMIYTLFTMVLPRYYYNYVKEQQYELKMAEMAKYGPLTRVTR